AAELAALRGVGQRVLVGALRDAQSHRGRAQTLAVVRVHQPLEAVAGADQEVLARDLAALEVQLAFGDAAQAHHEFAPADAEARRVALDEDPADAVGALPLAEARVHEIEPGGPRAGDPALVAGQPVARRRVIRARRHVGGRRAGGGLGDGDDRLLTLQHPGEVAALLRLGTVGDQRAHRAEVALDHDAPGDAA